MKIRKGMAFSVAMLTILLAATLSFAQDSTAKVNINTASQTDLAGLPGMSKKKADKVIAGRPYSSDADLSKSGLSAKQIQKITPLITFEGGSAAAASSETRSSTEAPAASIPPRTKSQNSSATSSSANEVVAQTPPQPGMVWVTRRTKVYHVQGDRWYGKTKHGEWMTEEDALKAGYRKSK